MAFARSTSSELAPGKDFTYAKNDDERAQNYFHIKIFKCLFY